MMFGGDAGGPKLISGIKNRQSHMSNRSSFPYRNPYRRDFLKVFQVKPSFTVMNEDNGYDRPTL